MKKIGIVIVIAFLVMLSVTTGATASETNAEVPSEVLSEVPGECVSGGVIAEILDNTNNRITLQLVDGTA